MAEGAFSPAGEVPGLLAFATEGRAGTSVDVTVDDRPACDLLLDRYAEDRPEDLAAWLAEPGDAA